MFDAFTQFFQFGPEEEPYFKVTLTPNIKEFVAILKPDVMATLTPVAFTLCGSSSSNFP